MAEMSDSGVQCATETAYIVPISQAWRGGFAVNVGGELNVDVLSWRTIACIGVRDIPPEV
jgi:hypothetical protein